MNQTSLTHELDFSSPKPSISVLFETEYSKEIRIVLAKGQIMKAHQTPFPIVIEVFKGLIDFGVEGTQHSLNEGSLVHLKGLVRHDLKALENSVVRLSISKTDKVERVKAVVED